MRDAGNRGPAHCFFGFLFLGACDSENYWHPGNVSGMLRTLKPDPFSA